MKSQKFSIDEVISLLKEARNRIANGWCKYKLSMYDISSGNKCYCAMGALGYTSSSEYSYRGGKYSLKAEAAKLLKNNIPSSFMEDYSGTIEGYIANWNNSNEVTQLDVLTLFDKTIASLQMQSIPQDDFFDPLDNLLSEIEPKQKRLTNAEKIQLALKGEI